MSLIRQSRGHRRSSLPASLWILPFWYFRLASVVSDTTLPGFSRGEWRVLVVRCPSPTYLHPGDFGCDGFFAWFPLCRASPGLVLVEKDSMLRSFHQRGRRLQVTRCPLERTRRIRSLGILLPRVLCLLLVLLFLLLSSPWFPSIPWCISCLTSRS